MTKFAKVKVHSTDAASLLQFRVKIVATLKDALANLPAIERSSKPEVVVIFSYDTHGESLYIQPSDLISVDARILREEDNQEEDIYNPSRKVLLAPRIFICNNAGSVNVQAFATSLQTRVWSAYRTIYMLNTKRSFRKLVMDPRPLMHLIHSYPTVVD